MSDIKQSLRQLPVEERRRLFPGLGDEELQKLMGLSEREILLAAQKCMAGQRKWYDAPLCGLSEEGIRRLEELTEQMELPSIGQHVERKQVRYLKQLKQMRLKVPNCFREKTDPRAFYHYLVDFCRSNDIPEEIVHRVVPALVTYMETGHMRPIIFVGEKGCGKTTAVKLLVQEALRLPTEIIKIPQLYGGHGMTGDCASYQAADAGCLAKARLRANNLLVAYLLDEIDKVTHGQNRANVDDELLSITDESCSDIYDNYLETTLVGLEHCPMFMTANDLQNISPILVDRCSVIHFPNASAERIKAISRKYVDNELKKGIYSLIRMDYGLMDVHIDNLVNHDVTSLRKHQQMIEAAMDNALRVALVQESEESVFVTEEMFRDAEIAVMGTVKRSVGFAR